MSSQETLPGRMRRDGILELLEEYMDIRDELEYTLDSFSNLQEDIGLAMEDISEQLDVLQGRLVRTGSRLRRFKMPAPVRQYEIFKEQSDCDLPFDNEC